LFVTYPPAAQAVHRRRPHGDHDRREVVTSSQLTAAAAYVNRVLNALVAGRYLTITDTCPECDQRLTLADIGEGADHVLATTAGSVVVIVGCEGYWVIPPHEVGIDRPTWSPSPGPHPDWPAPGPTY